VTTAHSLQTHQTFSRLLSLLAISACLLHAPSAHSETNSAAARPHGPARHNSVEKDLELAKRAEANLQCDAALRFDRSAQSHDNQQHTDEARNNGSVINYRDCVIKMKFNKAVNGTSAQTSFAIGGGFDADGDLVRAKTIYRSIIERFASSPAAVKAADRLTHLADVERIEASNREAASRIERTNAEAASRIEQANAQAAERAERVRQENAANAQRALAAKEEEERQLAYYRTGEVYESGGYRSSARIVYQKVIDSYPNSAAAARAAERLRRLADLDAVEASNREAAQRIELANADAAKQELRKRQENEALAKQAAAAKQEAEQLQALYLRGDVYESNGDRDRAKSVYRQVIDQYPQTSLALKAAERLRHIAERERGEAARREAEQQHKQFCTGKSTCTTTCTALPGEEGKKCLNKCDARFPGC
jgi:tetratricopeptide (TPR) repeat protein